jgi:hypothetical protein
MQYSFKKGFLKGALSLLAVGGAIVAFAGFQDVSLWTLVENYIKPLLGSLTVGGVITIAVNYIKFKTTK